MLIDREHDDAELLRAEDEAIREAQKVEQETLIPVGEDLAKLIEDLTENTAQ